jgi:hypothetical protein
MAQALGLCAICVSGGGVPTGLGSGLRAYPGLTSRANGWRRFAAGVGDGAGEKRKREDFGMTHGFSRSRGIGFSAGNFPTSRAKGAREVGHPGSCSTTVRERGRSLAPLVKTRGLRDDAWFHSLLRDWFSPGNFSTAYAVGWILAPLRGWSWRWGGGKADSSRDTAALRNDKAERVRAGQPRAAVAT